jgi:hypothetical protein
MYKSTFNLKVEVKNFFNLKTDRSDQELTLAGDSEPILWNVNYKYT